MNSITIIHKKLLSTFGAACLVLFVFIFIALQLSRKDALAIESVQNTFQELNIITKIRSLTFRIELDLQNYRITGNQNNITDQEEAIKDREFELQQIKQHTINDPIQQLKWIQLHKLIDEHIATSIDRIDLKRKQGQDLSKSNISTVNEVDIRNHLFSFLINLENDCRKHLDARILKSSKLRKLTNISILIIGSLLIIHLVVTYLVIRKQVNEIETSRNELEISEKKLTITLKSIGDGVITTDTVGCVTQMNPIAEQLTGWPFPDAVGRPIEDIFNIYNESTGQQSVIPIVKVIQTREIQTLQNHTILFDRNGNPRPIGDSAAPIIDPSGNLTGVVMVFRDVSLERQAARVIKDQNVLLEKAVLDRTFELQETEENLRRVTDNVPALIAHVKTDLQYDYANSKYIDLFMPNNRNMLGLTVREVLGESRFEKVKKYIEEVLLGNSVSYDWQPFPDLWQTVNYVPTFDKMGMITGYYVLITDITDRKLSEIKTYNITHYDGLTGLPNELLFTEQLNEAIESGKQFNQSFSLIQINIEKLSEINDALGFGGGDQVLQEISKRLKLAFASTCNLSRLRGDEFAVLINNSSAIDAIALAQKVETLLAEPTFISNIALDISAKIGIAIFPDHGVNVHDLYRHLDFAVRDAKKKGSRFQVFDNSQDSDIPHRLAMAAELRHAIEKNELELYFQPKIEISSRTVIGAEALVRWNHPKRGLVSPLEFIPLAEQMGLINQLTQWVMNDAMVLICNCRETGINIPIAVNISARNLHEEDLVEKIQLLKLKWNIGADIFEIEITESAIMENAEYALQVLQLLREQEIPLSIDDFGTGYSSLSYLQKLPVQYIKIDKSFVSDMLINKKSLVIVRSTIELSHDLGKKVIAEGVETQEQLESLTALGCDIAQGYYFAKPMQKNMFLNWMKNYKLLLAA
jgi:diguanylate cyclase (GGDEF)-like protein/PAS domain S-box-containing protein